METAAVPGPFASSSSPDQALTTASVATATAAYDDDARHYATSALPASKTTLTGNLPPLSTISNYNSEMTVKDLKAVGTRFHEDCLDTDLPSPRLRSSRTWRGRGTEMLSAERERKKPLGLLDLPIDVLKDIVREVTHTNDLTSLALCHSALHRLTVPHIYSRFDIVWPDTSTHAEPRSGVDALTYGLATLVMAEEIFGEGPTQRRDGGNRFAPPNSKGAVTETVIRRRRGNHYAQYTKKFSLGNGPADWVQEYLISKEGGKMLGTLVALAVARMRSLETFVWDMPTGILRDVWLALSSLADRDDERECRLEKVWVRWHDNTPTDPSHALPPPLQASGNTIFHLAHATQIRPSELDRVEHPNFSVLPPLKSLSVLDIDELAYLDEMAVLIGRSLDKLRELRVGIARHVINREWVTVWEGDDLQQVDCDLPTAGFLTIGEKRLGGILGTLTGFVHDMRKPRLTLPDRTRRPTPERDSVASRGNDARPDGAGQVSAHGESWTAVAENRQEGATAAQTLSPLLLHTSNTNEAHDNDPLIASSRAASPQPLTPVEEVAPTIPAVPEESPLQTPEDSAPEAQEELPPRFQHKLQLESLELERTPLSIAVLQQAIDWSKLTCLTILHCHNHETLWKTLRRSFAPTPKSPTYPATRRTPTSTPKKGSRSSLPAADLEIVYPLNLKRIHTNTVSPALVSFLKETLAPNSLEVLFLQEARSYASTVTIESIFKGPMRRHRTSLKKLLIDSSEKGLDGLPTSSSRWRRWMLSREILAFLCSGKMPRLRELGMAIEYRDWHFFLQHLPSISHLRSLYIPFLADHVHGADVDPRELALQIVDIVALRPEVELCYMGIANKCFEILENKNAWDGRPESHLGLVSPDVGSSDPEEEDSDEIDDEMADVEDDMDEDDVAEDTESETSVDDTDSDVIEASNQAKLRLREILFYDDKVAVFRARHGRL